MNTLSLINSVLGIMFSTFICAIYGAKVSDGNKTVITIFALIPSTVAIAVIGFAVYG